MKKYVVLLIKILLTLTLLYYIFLKIPFSSILEALSSADIMLIFISIFLTLPTSLLSSFQTKYLTSVQKMSISFKEILKVELTTGFYSLFLPGSLSGGAVKWHKFTSFGSKSSAAVVVFFNRYLEIYITIFIGILFSVPTVIESRHKILIIFWIIAVILLWTSYILLIHINTLYRLEKILNRIPFSRRIRAKLENLAIAMNEFRNLTIQEHLEIIFIMFLYHLIGIIAFYLLAKSLNISLNIFVIGWMRSAVIISNMIPVSVSGFGIRENVIIYCLHFYGVPPNEAVALSFLYFFRNLFGPLVGGIIEIRDFLLCKK